MARTKKELKNELDKIVDTVDIDFTNQLLEMSGEQYEKLKITKKTLMNISKWALDGKSQFEIAQNLELSKQEWNYLCKVCPAILFVMQRSQAYADIVVAGTLYQTAIGGHTIKKKTPIKIKEYDNIVIVKGRKAVKKQEQKLCNMTIKYLNQSGKKVQIQQFAVLQFFGNCTIIYLYYSACYYALLRGSR